MGEFERKAQECVVDERICEMNGREVVKVNGWLKDAVEREISEVGEKFDSIF